MKYIEKMKEMNRERISEEKKEKRGKEDDEMTEREMLKSIMNTLNNQQSSNAFLLQERDNIIKILLALENALIPSDQLQQNHQQNQQIEQKKIIEEQKEEKETENQMNKMITEEQQNQIIDEYEQRIERMEIERDSERKEMETKDKEIHRLNELLSQKQNEIFLLNESKKENEQTTKQQEEKEKEIQTLKQNEKILRNEYELMKSKCDQMEQEKKRCENEIRLLKEQEMRLMGNRIDKRRRVIEPFSSSSSKYHRKEHQHERIKPFFATTVEEFD